MVDNRNTFDFDASGAIKTLAQLEQALLSAAKSIRTLDAQASKQIVDPFGNPIKSVQRYREEAARAAAEVEKGLKRGKRGVDDLTLSWKTFARVVQTQLIVRGINEVRDLFLEAADSAEQFQLQVARISQIAPDATFGQITEELRDLAVELGRPLEEVGTAAFEALQNDIADGLIPTLEVLRKDAQALALVTGGTLPQSVNALSSAIRGFNLQGEAATDVSSKFFAAIDAGRITLAELENSLGTVANLGRQLGVSLDETLASVAAITRTGTSAAVAFTQLRNIFNKSIKPTEQLTEIFEELGVKGFKQLREEQGGFIKALLKIRDAVDGDEQALSKVFNTIRANVGIFNLLAENADDYEKILVDIEKSGGRAAKAVDEINQTEARDAQINAAKLERVLNELGDSALKVKNNFTEAFLAVVPTADLAIVSLGGVTAAIVAATVAQVGFTTALGGTKAALGTITPFAIAAAAVIGTVFITNEVLDYLETLKGVNDEFGVLEQKQKNIAGVDLLNKEALDELEEGFKRGTEALDGLLDGARVFRNELITTFRDSTSEISDLGGDILKRFGDGRKRLLSEVGKEIDSIDKSIRDTTKQIGEDQADLEAFKFEEEIKDFKEIEQVSRRVKRVREQTAKIRVEAFTGGDLDALRSALKRNDAEAKTARSTADRLGNERLIEQSTANQENIIRARIALGEEENRRRKETPKEVLLEEQRALTKLSADQEKLVAKRLALEEQVAKARAGGAGDAVVAAQEKQIGELGQQIDESFKKFADADILKRFGLTNLATSLNQEIVKGLAGLDVAFGNAVNNLRTQLADSELEATVRLKAVFGTDNTPAVQEIVNTSLAGTDDPVQQVDDATTGLQDFVKTQQEVSGEITAAGAALEASSENAKQAFEEATSFDIIGGLSGQNLALEVTSLGRAAIASIGTASKEELIGFQNALKDQLLNLKTELKDLSLFDFLRADDIKEGITSVVEAIATQLEIIDKRSEVDIEASENSKAVLSRIEDVATTEIEVPVEVDGAGEVERLEDNVKDVKDEAIKATGATASIGPAALAAQGGVRSLTTTARGLADAFNSAADAAVRVQQEQAKIENNPFVGQNRRHGGQLNYRAAGGTGRGQDTFPAMLSPDEFILNARAGRNFFGTAQALNSDRTAPDSGGGGTTITVGDINITATSQIPAENARQLGREINREIRRGTIGR